MFSFLAWHFYQVPKILIKAWRNFLIFNWNVFSINLLFKTFFRHWKKYIDSYGRGFDPGRYFMTFMSNMVSRVLGALVRTFAILTGILAEVFIFFAGILVLAMWILSPFVFILGVLTGVYLL